MNYSILDNDSKELFKSEYVCVKQFRDVIEIFFYLSENKNRNNMKLIRTILDGSDIVNKIRTEAVLSFAKEIAADFEMKRTSLRDKIFEEEYAKIKSAFAMYKNTGE